MKRFLFLLTVTSLALAACGNTPAPDVKSRVVATAAPRASTSAPPAASGIPTQEGCVTERPLALWETKGPALEGTVRCIEELANHWWEEGEFALLWESSDPNWGAQKLAIAPDGQVGIGCCDGLFLPLQLQWHNEDLWGDIQARFAAFHYELEGEKLTFEGKGEITSPAWQRAIRTWSRTVWGQLYTGHVCAACSTVLAWRHQEWRASEETDYCATLVVTDVGRVAVTSLAPCDGSESDSPATELLYNGWLSTEEWGQFDTWLYSRDATNSQDGQFSGRGSQQMSDAELLELTTWVESVYTRTIGSLSPTAIQPTGAPTPGPPTPVSVPTEMHAATPTVSTAQLHVPSTVGPTANRNAVTVLVGTIIDGTGADPMGNAAIVIQNGRIAAVGPRQDVEIPSNATFIELHEATILPGFINAHVHSAYEPALLAKWAQAGVTTVRDLGAPYPFVRFSTRDRNNEDPNLATVISAGPIITVPGGYPIASGFPSLGVTTPDHARREVTRLISDGADVIKIFVDSGEGLPTISLDRASAIVETAHQRNVPVAAHIGSLRDLQLVLDAGVDDFSHIVPEPIPGDVLEQLVADNVVWVPTLETAGGFDAGNLRIFVAAGGQVALGNDSGFLPGMEIGMPMREIEMMNAAGMSPMEIIVAATRHAAYACNREDALGTLEVGKIADILVVDGDPLVDLHALTDVRLVIHQGVIIRDSAQK